jgi:Kef-type K+ transport system membrane component KefB
MNENRALFIICFIAVLAPLATQLPALILIPSVVLELTLGILIGPSGANLVTSQGAIGFLGEFGLMFLFFQAGFEFKPDKIGVAPIRLGALAWLASLGLSIIFVGVLYFVGLVRAPLLVGLILPTTAFGILIPILRETGELESNFGRHVLGSAAIGELGPLIVAPLVLAQAHQHLRQSLLSMIFLAIVIVVIVVARSLRSERLSRTIARWMGDSSILPVRISILILLGLTAVADKLGMEMILGAYTAGMVIANITKVTILQYRLTSIGSGFFIPLFFVTSGLEFDLPGLVTSPASLARLILFCAGFLLVRIFPILLYKRVLPERELLPLALFSSTTLPLVVAVTYLGVRTGDMLPENASALVGAAVITVAVFPAFALLLRAKSEGARPDGVVAIAAHRVADLASALFSRFIVFISQKHYEKP